MFLWPCIQQIPALALAEVHVYAWDLDISPLAADWKILSEEETARARRFVFPRDMDRYARAHAGMRRILGKHAGIDPAEIAYSNSRYGKPRIENERVPEGLQFNLSHSAGMALLTVAHGYELGVDIEVLRPVDRDVAEHHFSPDELLALNRLPPEQWQAGFFRCWTGKEALLKGEGCGLNLALDAFDVEVDPRRGPALLASRMPDRMAPGWLLEDLKPARDAVGTLAVRDATEQFTMDAVRCFSLNG